MTNRFFVEDISGERAEISGSESHHLKDVLRKKKGDAVFLFDGKGAEYKAEIERFTGDSVVLKVLTKMQKSIEPRIKINLFQSIPKINKFDYIVEKATELGVSKIVPVVSERTQVPLIKETDFANKKLTRWRKIAISAAKQSGRAVIPEITEITDFKDTIKSVCVNKISSESLSLIPWESEDKITLKEILKTANPQLSTVNLFIGPEGGFAAAEIELAKKCGILPVSLGKRILRTETAPIAVISNILYELE